MPFRRGRVYLQVHFMEEPMTFQLSSLLYKSAALKREIDVEQRRGKPDRLRLMRLQTLRLKLMERLHALSRHPAVSQLRSGGPASACC
jgi:hypothetical protein